MWINVSQREYIKEEELIDELLKIVDKINVNELGMRHKLEEEIKRFNKFQSLVLKTKGDKEKPVETIDIRTYAKYLLKEGSITEKRELLANLRSRLIYKNKKIILVRE